MRELSGQTDGAISVAIIGPDRSRCGRWRAQIPLAAVQISALPGAAVEVEPHSDAFDVVLLDISGCADDGVALTKSVRAGFPRARLLILGDELGEAQVVGLVGAGARGYDSINIRPDLLARAVEMVASGGVWFSRGLLPALLDAFGPREKVAVTVTAAEPPKSGDLSPPQQDVARLVGEGFNSRQISEELGVSDSMVHSHLAEIYRKLGVRNRVQLAVELASEQSNVVHQ